MVPLFGTVFATQEHGFKTSFAHGRQPAEQVIVGSAARIGNLGERRV
jgi:hypothetical protein